MEGNKDQFFDMFKESFDGFAPEAPESVYAGMRSKLFWTGFTKFNASRFNAWYLALIIGAASVTGGVCLMDEAMQGQTALMNNAIDELVFKPHNQIVDSESWEDSEISEETIVFDVDQVVTHQTKKQNCIEETAVTEMTSLKTDEKTIVKDESSSVLAESSNQVETDNTSAVVTDEVNIQSNTTELENVSTIQSIPLHEIDNVRFHKDIMRQLNSDKGEIVIDLVVKLPTAEE